MSYDTYAWADDGPIDRPDRRGSDEPETGANAPQRPARYAPDWRARRDARQAEAARHTEALRLDELRRSTPHTELSPELDDLPL